MVERGLAVSGAHRAYAGGAQHGLDYIDIGYASVDSRAAATLNPRSGSATAGSRRVSIRGGLLLAVADPTSAGLAELRATLHQRVVFAVSEVGHLKMGWYAILPSCRPKARKEADAD